MFLTVCIAESMEEIGKVAIWLCYADEAGHGELKIAPEFEDEETARCQAERMFYANLIFPKPGHGLSRMFNKGWRDIKKT